MRTTPPSAFGLALAFSKFRRFIAAGIVVTLMLLARAGAAAAQNPPGAPSGLTAQVSGNTVTLNWTASILGPTTYIVEAGSAPGLANLATMQTGSIATSLTVTSVPGGVYYIRVRAANAAGASPPSNEITIVVGLSCTLPQPPSNLAATVNGLSVTLTWTSAAGEVVLVEAGTAAGLSDVFNGAVGAITTLTSSAPAGTYYLRVRARNACGTTPASNEVVIGVGVPAAPLGISAVTSGSTVTLNWLASVGPGSVGYVLEAGSAPGLRNLATISTGLTPTRYSAAGVPPGLYFVRVRAVGIGGAGAPSPDFPVVVGTPAGATVIGFAGLAPNNAPFVSHTESGFTVMPVSGPWMISTGFGKPGPSVLFPRLSADPPTAEVSISAGGTRFRFHSVDLYSSITTIPHVITGRLGSTSVFTMTGTVSNTFGGFATVPNLGFDGAIDALVIQMTNPVIGNSVGLDNIVVTPQSGSGG
jgi:hypothetical protein